jgi:phosphomannomutase/phosphoglucomutase
MFPKPKSVLVPNTYLYESEPMVKATGFREYDARWLFGKEINLMGIQALGMGLGALIANSASSRRSSPAMISAAIRPRSNTR